MKESVRVVRFAIIGTLNALITALVVMLLMHCGESYLIANVAAYVVAQIHNFVWCKYWIFPLERGVRINSLRRQVLWFVAAFSVAYTSQFLFLLFLVEMLHCNEYLAQFLGLFVYGGINFLANRLFTFR